MALFHESAIRHVTGCSRFVGDLGDPGSFLYGLVVYSTKSHARLGAIDTDEAKQVFGVRVIIGYQDIPGKNQTGVVVSDEPCLAEEEVHCIGQPILLIAAETMEAAMQARSLVRIEYEELPSILNQASSLVHIYQDGTLLLHHGGTEMGQGLHTKILGIACREMGLPASRFRVFPTSTSHVPNTSATAASSGSDLNGMAVSHALEILKERIAGVIASHFSSLFDGPDSQVKDIFFRDEKILDSKNPDRSISFTEAVLLTYKNQVSLSTTGYYKTPGIGFNPKTGKGNPFHYYAFGASVSEVLLDVLTGRFRILRTDILHDVGSSLNQAIDRGQIEGGFMQGVGWCTTEAVKWDDSGRLLNASPDTYKIPVIGDIPEDFRISLYPSEKGPDTIYGSKAVGEPPFMHAFSVWLALKDAVSAYGNHLKEPVYSLPASVEVLLRATISVSEEKKG